MVDCVIAVSFEVPGTKQFTQFPNNSKNRQQPMAAVFVDLFHCHLEQVVGFHPKISIEIELQRFTDWYVEY